MSDRPSIEDIRIGGNDRLMDVDLERRIRFAIGDPGAILPRGDNYTEPLHAWQARAVMAVLPGPGGEQS